MNHERYFFFMYKLKNLCTCRERRNINYCAARLPRKPASTHAAAAAVSQASVISAVDSRTALVRAIIMSRVIGLRGRG